AMAADAPGPLRNSTVADVTTNREHSGVPFPKIERIGSKTKFAIHRRIDEAYCRSAPLRSHRDDLRRCAATKVGCQEDRDRSRARPDDRGQALQALLRQRFRPVGPAILPGGA